jgi:adenylate kinase
LAARAQCELIVSKYGLAHVSSGDLLRSEVEGSTAYGEAARDSVERGELAPDDVVVPIVLGRLGEDDAVAKGWLLDGFPRSADQGGALADAGFAPDVLILLEVPEAVLLARVAGRVLDPATGKIYNREFAPPPAEAQGRLQTRKDDGAEATARTRLAVFAAHADAVLARYADVACRVDGNRDPQAVFADVDAALQRARAKA